MTQLVIGSSSTSFGAATASWTSVVNNDGWAASAGAILDVVQDNTNVTYIFRQTDGTNLVEFVAADAVLADAAVTSVEWALIARIDAGAGSTTVRATRNDSEEGIVDPDPVDTTFDEHYFIIEEAMTGATFNASSWGFATEFDAGMAPVQVAEFAVRVTYTGGTPPEVFIETLPATNVAAQSATINGHLEPDANEALTYFFTWGFNLLMVNQTHSLITVGPAEVDASVVLVDLPVGVTVYFRFRATRESGGEVERFAGETLSFTTEGSEQIVISF